MRNGTFLSSILPRRQFLRVASRALREGRVGWTVRQTLKTVTLPLARKVDRPLSGPLVAHLIVTYRCNNVCYQCDLPRPWYYRKRGDRELDTGELKDILSGLARLGVAGVNFSGGEPTLRHDLLELMSFAKSLGMNANLSTNAFTLNEPAKVKALLATGVDSINISLDGACPETHDRLRGAPGSFERVRLATEQVVALRQNGRPSLTYVFVIGTDNHREIRAFLDLARDRGVDSVGFMPVFDVYRERQERADNDQRLMEQAVVELRQLKRSEFHNFIDNTDAYLSLFGKAWRAEASPLQCYATYQNLVIDSYGNVFPCALPFSDGGEPIGNVRGGDVAAFWHSEAYQGHRRRLDSCRACLWNCHTEVNLLYQKAPAG